ncbi:1-acyl-sn-glycerol-3-phosphate acyltransferase [Defluviimonas sp. WL0002]|uniref:1-acyl-sn-glycerol-3-phosphate acyltransferase n=1 Tax=Albidovulum marisflavi TaxID=2984159 RepID=A0ABT2Z7M7_9RHOB|nr:lysophospholipid acyltransferase family protein [Defluviimonas sp. WL0002]MCV2867143.1 1-acyl-sn-glycerol-3-phosphate acyltransferase [Defluviimonas sp. WL0002]
MRLALQYLLSLIFILQMYLAMAVYALAWLPAVIWRKENAVRAVHGYTKWVRWSAAAIVGLRSEIRGEVPRDEVVIAAKHQSFFDIILIISVVPRPKFIMKKELLWAPIVGWYAKRLGCIPVDRGRGGEAMRKMVAEVKAARTDVPGQLIIYPQGTRVAAGAHKPYKVGVGVLYAQLKRDCVPAATNVGVFWPRHGLLRKPGLAVVEFLPRIPAGKRVEAFMNEIEPVVEDASNRLMEEAGFSLPG